MSVYHISTHDNNQRFSIRFFSKNLSDRLTMAHTCGMRMYVFLRKDNNNFSYCEIYAYIY